MADASCAIPPIALVSVDFNLLCAFSAMVVSVPGTCSSFDRAAGRAAERDRDAMRMRSRAISARYRY